MADADPLPDERLFAALHARDVAAARAALAAGADAAAVREYEFGGERMVETATESTLQAAVHSGVPELLDLLLANGVRCAGPHREIARRALFTAVEAGAAAMVERLLRAGADPALPAGHGGEDAFARAIAGGHLDLARRLREAGAPSSVQALLHACRRGDRTAVGLCLRSGVTTTSGPVLAEAARFDQVALLDWLATHGADVAREAGPALVAACHSGAAGAVRWLLERGAPVAHRNEYAWLPLHFAAYAGHVEIVRLLLAHGADRAATCGQGRTARSWAEEAGHGDVLRLLDG